MPQTAAFAALAQATAGAVGGAFASFVLQPIEVAKTRIQVGRAPAGGSTLAVCSDVVREEGIAGLYRGLVAKCSETAAKNFVYFYIYDWLFQLTKKKQRASTLLNLLIGFLAGVGTVSLTMPLEVLSTRLQAEPQKGITTLQVFRKIVEKEGVSGFFRGYPLNVMLCVNPAIQNTTFDKIKDWILHLKSRGNLAVFVRLSPTEAFLLGALAKAIATMITYPIVKIKTILQAGSAAKAANDGKGEDLTLMEKIGLLYRGLSSSLLKTVLQAALLYMMKDQIAGTVVKALQYSSALLRPSSQRQKLKAVSGRPLFG